MASFLGAAAALPADGMQVSQRKRTFYPKSAEIARGASIGFSNEDEFIHHVFVKSDTFNFDSGEQKPGEQVVVQFTRSGTYDVLCAIHPKMRLVVTVE